MLNNIVFIIGLLAVVMISIGYAEYRLRSLNLYISDILLNHAEAIRKLQPPKQ